MIPLVDLKAQYASIRDEVNAEVIKTLESSQFILGKQVSDFEDSFAAYCQADHAIALNSGTSALHLALLAAGVGPGDEVISVSMTFVATTAAIIYTGATPVLVDIDPVTYTLDTDKLEGALSERTKAIVPVHLHGLVANMDPIMAFARKHGLIVIEDAAQAHGAEYKDRRAGSFGDINCFSFYPGKNLGAYGEGGAVVCSDPKIAEKIRMFRDWGQEGKGNHVLQGYNYRMDGVQGAVLNVKLKYIEQWTESRRRIAAQYTKNLQGHSLPLPVSTNEHRHVFHVYAVRVENRERVQSDLAEAGISTGVHYPSPVHLQPAYKDAVRQAGDLTISETVAREFLSLPIYAELGSDQVDHICEALLKSTTKTG